MSRYVSVYEIHPYNHDHFTTMIIDGTDRLSLDDEYFGELLGKNSFVEPYDAICWHFLITGKELMKLYACQEEIVKKMKEDTIYIVEWDI